MGVTYVTQWIIPEGKSLQQGVEDLQALIEKLGGKKTGLFTVECESFHCPNASSAQLNKTLHTMSNTEYPASRYAFFEDGSFLVTDVMLTAFLSKLRGYWSPKKGGKIECKGNRYQLADFILKVGIVTVGPSTKGVAFEIEYMPCIFPRDGWGLMAEMLQDVIGDQAPADLPQIFQKTDATLPYLMVYQYIDMFNNMRKANVVR